MGHIVRFRRRTPKLPPQWQRYRARGAWSARDLRITVWIGLILGLLAFHALRLAAPSPAPVAAPPIERSARMMLEAQEGAPPPALASEGRGRALPAAVRIIDGDTFEYGGARIRVADIDTPEVRGRCAHERDLAARATRRMEALLAAGPFELEPFPGRDEDRYGRKLRLVTRDGRSLGDQLVAEGLARTWTGRREPWCA